ncbi:hypothetical protein LOTGIDRAFT_153597 [Lottia gigantea]|uniref:Uncharacterized protein n=1 Tax=Lottia gigantea TaxID=225164 RepID=V4ACW2_LOTGI|nr:hypothetical protein LOTGIDRAFT_153597 [Lottia gigantea]ESO91166.1 hypothetical protein LOTGIDRAFT_153597 [Lottia gigantea]
MSSDWNNIFKRNKEYIKAKNKIKSQVENNKLQQLGLTENLQTICQPILKSQEDIKKKLALEYRPPIEPHKDHPEPNQYDGIIIRSLDDINSLFSNPKADLPKSITPIVDDDGSYEYVAINDYLSEYGGSLNGRNNIGFEGNLNLNKIKLILRNNSQVDFNVENSLNTLLGFDKRVYTHSTLAPHKANIENDIDVINIHCNLINGGFFNKYKRIPTFTVPIGYRIIEKPFQTTYLPLNSFIKDINLEIKDGKNRFIDFGNEEIVIQLHLKQKN